MTKNETCSYNGDICYYDSIYFEDHPKDKPDCCEKCYYHINDMEWYRKEKELDKEMEQLEREREYRAEGDAHKLKYQCNGDSEEAIKRLDSTNWSDEYKNKMRKYL